VADLIASDSAFSPQHKQLLATLAERMIPADADFPSAADPDILSRALARLSASEPIVTRGLDALQELAASTYQRSFAILDAAQQQLLIDQIRAAEPAFIQTLQAHVVSSYYQDDRVLLALGLPVRPPHPGGYQVAATDWSLLDPVRERQPFYLHLQDGPQDV